jgi:hypothetical protein
VFLTSAIFGVELFASRPDRFTPVKSPQLPVYRILICPIITREKRSKAKVAALVAENNYKVHLFKEHVPLVKEVIKQRSK